MAVATPSLTFSPHSASISAMQRRKGGTIMASSRGLGAKSVAHKRDGAADLAIGSVGGGTEPGGSCLCYSPPVGVPRLAKLAPPMCHRRRIDAAQSRPQRAMCSELHRKVFAYNGPPIADEGTASGRCPASITAIMTRGSAVRSSISPSS
jgi:hypothetical protein